MTGKVHSSSGVRTSKPDPTWWTIIGASGNPMVYETGAVVLFPTVDAAERWMVPSDQRIELWRGAAGMHVGPEHGVAPSRHDDDQAG